MAGYSEHVMRLARQLGARRFEAQDMEMRARMLLDAGRPAEAAEMLREALAICRETGAQFTGPKVVGAFNRAVTDPAERTALLREGREMLARGAVGHNHLWFHRDAIEALLAAGDAAGAPEHVAALEDYTRTEPLPWSDLFAARGRALAGVAQRTADHGMREELVRIRAALADAGLKPFLPTVDAALAT